MDTSLNEKQQEHVNHVYSGGKHLLSLIDEILDLERVATGKVELVMESVDMREVIQECERLTRSQAKMRKIQLTNLLPANDACLVWADKKRPIQAVLNLVSNARKYNHDAGHVESSCEAMANNQTRIKVRDEGLGINEQNMNQLFEPFSRLGAKNTNVEDTGITLTITKNLVVPLGGGIVAESIHGVGSTFSIILPTTPG